MAPKKQRRLTDGSEGSSSTKKKKGGDDAVATEVEVALRKAKPWATAVLARFDKMMEEHGSIDRMMTQLYLPPNKLQGLADNIEHAFEPDECTVYSSDLALGKKVLRPWMLGWLPELGNKGLAVQEDMRALVSLMVVNGCLTNADVLPGVEKLVVAAVPPEFVEVAKPFASIKVHGYGIGLGQVAMVKGWSRANAIWFVTTSVLELGLLDEMKMDGPVYHSFCSVYCIVHDYGTLEKQIFANREAAEKQLQTAIPFVLRTWNISATS